MSQIACNVCNVQILATVGDIQSLCHITVGLRVYLGGSLRDGHVAGFRGETVEAAG